VQAIIHVYAAQYSYDVALSHKPSNQACTSLGPAYLWQTDAPPGPMQRIYLVFIHAGELVPL
jgi:hypothetical protein